MRLTWLGHSGFRMEIGGAVLLLDPWMTGNPVFPEARRAEAVEGATHVLLTHGHGDHASDAVAIARERGIPIACGHELAERWAAEEGVETLGFGKGGTVALAGARVTMVHATHSSSVDFGGDRPTYAGPTYAGGEAGFMIAHGGRTAYVSGDTDIMADMAWMGELHAPQIGILCCGGRYTMDIERAAWAARRYFAFETVVPCHYGTFPLLAPSAEPLREALPGVDVRIPAVMETIEI